MGKIWWWINRLVTELRVLLHAGQREEAIQLNVKLGTVVQNYLLSVPEPYRRWGDLWMKHVKQIYGF